MSTTETDTPEKTDTAETTAKITVIQAVYGAEQGRAEVTKRVQALVDQGRTSFIADNETLTPDGDPAKGHNKHFAMNYMVGSTRLAFACKEDQEVSLRTAEPRRGSITVIGAAYGAIDKNDPTKGARDVTAIVQELLDARPNDAVIKFNPNNTLFGDPIPNGPRKNFSMTYVSRKGSALQRRSLASDEDQGVTVVR
jgi:hypothetical protein